MISRIHKFFLLFLFLPGTLLSQDFSARNSVLEEGNWQKLSVRNSGVYKISYTYLLEIGLPVSSIDPQKIRIFTNRGGILPQENLQNTDFDPIETPIYIAGEGDGSFDPGDYILFYSEGLSDIKLDPEEESFSYETHYYSKERIILLQTNAPEDGLRVSTAIDVYDGLNMVDYNDRAAFHELDSFTRISSGREFFGERFSPSISQRQFDIADVSSFYPGSEVKMAVSILGFAEGNTSLAVSLSGMGLGDVEIAGLFNISSYSDQGRLVSDTFNIASSLVDTELEIDLAFNTQGNTTAIAWLDKLYLQWREPLSFRDNYMPIHAFGSSNWPVVSYEMSDFKAGVQIWDVTEIESIESLPIIEEAGNVAHFAHPGGSLKSLIAVDPSATFPTPKYVGIQENQNLKGSSAADLVIITPANFLSEANRLAAHRRAITGLDVNVVQLEEIYSEFNSGTPDVSAIRNYLRYMYYRTDSPGKLKYVLIMGKGTYDARNIRNRGLNFVPIYQSRNSVSPLRSYGSDDYLGFLEEDEGNWAENQSGDHDMEISVGRLPVKTLDESRIVVDKLIAYDIASDPGAWKSNIVYVVDDGDFNIHHNQVMQLSQFVDQNFSGLQPDRLFLDNFEQIQFGSRESSPAMTSEIRRQVEEGSLIVNFTGHGGPLGWTDEGILDNFDIEEWENKGKLPFFVTATCEYGRHDNNLLISGGENILLKPEGGAVGLVTTSRLVFSSTNFTLNKAFYDQVFKVENGELLRIGEVFRRTKNNSVSGVNNRNFALLADPSMKLSYPERRVELNAINGVSPDQETLSAKALVSLEGEITLPEGGIDASFNGYVDIRVFDKEVPKRTLGDENVPFQYEDWSSLIFRGQATVENGTFTSEFIVPRNIYYDLGSAKVLFYAVDEQQKLEASGSRLDIQVGGSSTSEIVDSAGPMIDLFMNDRTFRSGGLVPERSRLIIDLSDENGISITGVGVNNNLEFILDDEKPVALNEFYIAARDDFREGTVNYPLDELSNGRHTITVRARDTYGNLSSKTIEFRVGEAKEITLENTMAVPNPFSNTTKVFVEHNKAGSDLEVQVVLLSTTGQKVWQNNLQFTNSASRLEVFNWGEDLSVRTSLPGGVYICMISVFSPSEGLKNDTYSKLIYLK